MNAQISGQFANQPSSARRRGIRMAPGLIPPVALILLLSGALISCGNERCVTTCDDTQAVAPAKEASLVSELTSWVRAKDIPLSVTQPTAVAAGPYSTRPCPAEPCQAALSDNAPPELVLAAAGQSEVVIMSADGTTIDSMSVPAPPTCLAVRDAVYVGSGSRVFVVSPGTGSRRLFADLGSQALITSIAVDDDRVYIADAGNRLVMVYSHDATLVSIIGDSYHFRVPGGVFDVAIGPDDLLYVTNPGSHQIETYDSSGSIVASFGRASIAPDGFGGCCNPAHIAVDPRGTIVTSEKGTVTVKAFTTAGDLDSMIVLPAEFAQKTRALDITFLHRDLLVLDQDRGVIRRYQPPAAGASR